MEMGAFLDVEWESLSRMFSTEGEADFNFGTSSTFWPIDEASYMNNGEVDESLFIQSLFSDTFNTNLHCFSQETSNSSGSTSVFFPTLSHENHIQDTTNGLESMDFGAMDNGNSLLVPNFPDNDMFCVKEEIRSDKLGNTDDLPPTVADHAGKELQLKRKFGLPELHAGVEEKNDVSFETPKKKSRASRDAQKGKKTNAMSKKNQKLKKNGNDEEETNAETNGQSSTCYSSEDDSNANSQELNGGAIFDSKGSSALNSNGKTRANRGAATDPQSLYARKRRERINERLRILQNLVPSGTKVDISTMLEEAVHYVKFLQLQIKLLSSDDMWMYAPIAYNGMDMGLYHKISPTL